MRTLVKSLGLDEDTLDIYVKSLDKIPLTFKEIHSFKPGLSDEQIQKILEKLVENNLIIRIESRHSEYLPHYFTLPPFKVIEKILENLKGETDSAEIQATKISEKLHSLKQNLEDDIKKVRINVIQSLQERDLNQESLEFLDQFQNNIKKLFAVQMNNVLALIKQFAEQGKIEKTELSTYEQFTSEKIDETHDIVDRMFDEFDEIINEYAIGYVETQLEEDSLFLQTIKESIKNNLMEFLDEENKPKIKGLDPIINALREYVKSASIKTEIFEDRLWLLKTETKFFEEVSSIINQKDSKILIILFGRLEKLIEKMEENNLDIEESEIRIVSELTHDNEVVNKLKDISKNINYKHLSNENIIGIKGDNRVIIGTLLDKNKGEMTNLVGIGTNYEPFYYALSSLLEERWNKAKPEINEQIANGFNDIIVNINKYPGRNIGQKLEDILDIAFQKEGISLKLLELRILLSTLKNIYSPLDYELKEKVIETIHKLNNEFTSLPLEESPELESFPFESEEDKKYQRKLEEKLNFGDIEPVDQERIEHLFDLFIEKMQDLTGTQISEQIEKMIILVLQLQGFSDIIKWKDELASMKEFLEDPIQEEIIKDFLKWKKCILEPVELIEPQTKETSSQQVKSQAQLMDEEQNLSHQTQSSEGTEISVGQSVEDSEPETEEFSLKDKFENLKQKSVELSGADLSSLLQEIADVLLLSKGAMAIRDMRNYISKLRSIRDPLEDEIRTQFIEKVDEWIEKFG
ncbi:MAG: hypothetical protein BAJALOKI3v1_240004 [Promethearchaeota archaeon]|nr:MAG: hypothetical protein BAJALOKI3v1_240004 [Candidatus Lokiarchaeota archaeon]